MKLSQSEDLDHDSDCETEVKNRKRMNFVLRMSPYKKEDAAPLDRNKIWSHLSNLPNIREMIVAQEEIKIFPFQQDYSFVIFIIMKISVLEDEIMKFVKPLLMGKRVTSFDDPFRATNCTPEITIEGLIHKNRRNTIHEVTKVDMNCFYGGVPTDQEPIISSKHFHKK
jgi:hypothetical protein